MLTWHILICLVKCKTKLSTLFYYVVFPCNDLSLFIGRLRRGQENIIKG